MLNRSLFLAVCLAVILCGVSSSAFAGFVDTSAPVTGVAECSLAWGDYDGDGDFDLAVAGNSASGPISRIYTNDGTGSFTDSGISLIGVKKCSVAWGDYDNDGDVDLALAGSTGSADVSKIYRNQGNGVFVDSGITLTGVSSCSLAWADADNDGDLDLSISGSNGGAASTTIYRNDKNDVFTAVSTNVVSVSRSALAWGDYDRDADMDLAITGMQSTSSNQAYVYRNRGNFDFYIANQSASRVADGSLAWGDYNADGLLDMVIAGRSGSSFSSELMTAQSGGGFHYSSDPFFITGIGDSSLAWGDYDNDGNLDFIISGISSSGLITDVYRCYNSSSFSNCAAGLTKVSKSSTAWADIDDDGDLDLAVAGDSGSGFASKVYRNNATVTTTPPQAPADLAVTYFGGGEVTLRWNAASDDKTPVKGLTYNIRIGTSPGACDVYSGMADPSTGKRLVPAMGNTQQLCYWKIKGLDPVSNTYYWSVQAIDGCYKASPWAPELRLNPPELKKITGYIRTSSGNPITGVSMTANNWGGSGTSDSNGYYEVPVPAGWSGTVTPSKTSYWFQAPYTNYTNVIINFTGQDYTGYQFSEVSSTMTGVDLSCMKWGDYDNDGDLDLIVAGATSDYPNYNPVTKIYRNDNGSFNAINANLVGIFTGYVDWCDYDGDGDLDLGISGLVASSSYAAKIYRNDGNDTFTDINAAIEGGRSLSWGDYDNDGDSDLALVCDSGNTKITRIYRNDFGSFNTVAWSKSGIHSIQWADIDKDGDLDFGCSYINYGVGIYRNDGKGNFTAMQSVSNVLFKAWGDYDNDGDQDFTTDGISFYVNNGSGSFKALSSYGSFTFLDAGDFDNDGDLDIACRNDNLLTVLRNDGSGQFNNSGAAISLSGIYNAAWGDFDNDGDLDIALTAKIGSERSCKIFRNNGGCFNTLPSAPAGLSAITSPDGLCFTWSAATDAQTPVAVLSYNLRIGSSPGVNDVYASMSDNTSGFRRVVAGGNAKHTAWTLKGSFKLPARLYWSVQAVDTGFTGSLWAEEQQLDMICISGHIRTSAGSGVPGVAVITNNGEWTTLTDDNGFYELNVPPGWSGTVTPNKSFWVFDTLNKTYNSLTEDQSDQNYTATAYPRISGYVRTFAGSVVQDAGVAITGGTATTTDTNGYYEFRVIPGWSGTIAVSKNMCYFNPMKRVYAYVSSDLIDQNYEMREMVDTTSALPAVGNSSLDWGDYDNDGDLDIAIMGQSASGYISAIYKNENGSFTDIGAGLVGLNNGSIAWGDYDNDGDLDLALAGSNGSANLTKIYRNDNGIFIDVNITGLIPVSNCMISWIDYNNDGDLDVVVSGVTSGLRTTKIYRNSGGGSFVDSGIQLSPVLSSCMAWGDYDNDGDPDLALSGYASTYDSISNIYRNDGSRFTYVTSLNSVRGGKLAWGDYDNDGDLDIAGCAATYTKIYQNNNGTFADIGLNLPGAGSAYPAIAWGDVDCDGDLDLAVAAQSYFNNVTTSVYQNEGNGSFTSAVTGLPNISAGCLAWADYDNDGDADLAMTGFINNVRATKIYRNDSGKVNHVPNPPAELSAVSSENEVTFSWTAGIDQETGAPGLSYNLRVGTCPGSADVYSGMANLSSGYRLLPAFGNTYQRLSWTLKGLNPLVNTYYWSVQSIDSLFAGSSWAAEQIACIGQSPMILKASEDNTAVSCGSVVVSSSFPDYFYVERPDRSSGIRVDMPSHSVSVGKMVAVAGKMQTTTEGERSIAATYVTSGGSESIMPVFLSNLLIGGGPGGLQDGVWEVVLNSVDFRQAVGMNNIGLLVKTTGKVTNVDQLGRYFYIDDGSCCTDGTDTNGNKNIGIRVVADGREYAGAYIAVTGISSCFKGDNGKLLRLLRVDERDIKVVSP